MHPDLFTGTDVKGGGCVSLERRGASENGIALLIAIIALMMFSLLSLYMALNASTEVKVSDNYESQLQATYAAGAGMNHAREILRGIQLNDLLRGPDGAYDSSAGYLSSARLYAFRNPFDLTTARSLNIFNPASDLSGVPDDGIISTGKSGVTNGTQLIPLTGIALTAPNPYGAGTITTARYFVKITDNNGEASELAKDVSDNPFIDGDGIVIIRSLGVSKTITEVSGGTVRSNSVAVVEARFKTANQFNLDSPMVVEGPSVQAASPNMFAGNAFQINGLASNVGISTIDTNTSDGTLPYQQILSSLRANQYNNVRGLGASPSMADISAAVAADPDKSKLLDPAYLYNFATSTVPGFADLTLSGDVHLAGGSNPYDLGHFDYTQAYNAPGQRPKVTYVNGDLTLSGNIDGGGLLVVSGKFTGNGAFTYNGLVLVIGQGITDLSGVNASIHGGVYTTNVQPNAQGQPVFGTTKISLGGNSNIIFDSSAISLGVSLIPAVQLSWREIRTGMDPP